MKMSFSNTSGSKKRSEPMTQSSLLARPSRREVTRPQLSGTTRTLALVSRLLRLTASRQLATQVGEVTLSDKVTSHPSCH